MSPSGDSPRRSRADVSIYVRPLGSGLPLGFFAFGIGMFLLGVSALGWTPTEQTPDIGRLLLTFVAPLEAGAAIVAFLARDTATGTALAVFAGSWVTLGASMLTAAPGSTSDSAGFFLLILTAVIVLLAVAAMSGKPLIGVILVLAAVRGALAGAYQLGASKDVEQLGGVVALSIAALALYGGLAFLLEDIKRRRVLPVLRRGQARTSIEGDLGEQLERLDDEAGVRRQL